MSRENLLEQAEKLMDELASNKAILEIHYEDEVGWGLTGVASGGDNHACS